jgi:hypothetical protein
MPKSGEPVVNKETVQPSGSPAISRSETGAPPQRSAGLQPALDARTS